MQQRVVLCVIFVLAAGSMAAQPCSTEDLKGAYMFQTYGWANPAVAGLPGPDMNIPYAGLGIVMYDGKGKGSGKFWHAGGGQLSDREFTSFEYKVWDNCRGEATFRLKDPATGWTLGPERQAMTVSENGRRVRSISVDTKSGGIILSEQERIDREMPSCATDLIRGTYTMNYSGWLASTALNPSAQLYFMPAFGVASFHIDPAKGSTGGGTHNFGGMIFTTELKTATWTTNEDCTGTVALVARVIEGNMDSPMKAPYLVVDGGRRIVVLAAPYATFMQYTRESSR